MKSSKKNTEKPKKNSTDELRKPTKMAPTKEKDKNNWKNSSSDDFEDLDDQALDENFKGFDEFSDHGDDEDDDY